MSNVPLHAQTPLGESLPPDYFNPGTSVMNGKVVGSLWVLAYYMGLSFRYGRTSVGRPWVRIE